MDTQNNNKTNATVELDKVHTYRHNGVIHKTSLKNSSLKSVHKNFFRNHGHRKSLNSPAHGLTLKELEQKKAEALEEEYACLKILFIILGTEEFKDIIYEKISYIDDLSEDEIVIKSHEYKTHKIIKKSDFRTNFNYSPYAFIDFLHINGSKNDKHSNKNSMPVGYYSSEHRPVEIPKLGEYCLDESTGFWKKATAKDIELHIKRQKEPLYMKWQQQ